MTVTTAGPKGLYPDQSFQAQELIPDALIYRITTVAGSIEGDTPVVRVPYIATDLTAGFVAEGADITAADPGLDEVQISTGKIAVLTKLSREAGRYGTSLLSQSLLRSVTVKGNAALLGNASAPTGLINVAGIVDAGALDADSLDAIADAITAVEINGGNATHVVMDPASFGVLRSMKTATGSALPLLGAPGEQTGRQVFGVPIVVDQAMPVGEILVVDKTNIYSAAGQISVASSNDAYFGSDSIALRATWRIGWKVLRPNRSAKVSVTIPAP